MGFIRQVATIVAVAAAGLYGTRHFVPRDGSIRSIEGVGEAIFGSLMAMLVVMVAAFVAVQLGFLVLEKLWMKLCSPGGRKGTAGAILSQVRGAHGSPDSKTRRTGGESFLGMLCFPEVSPDNEGVKEDAARVCVGSGGGVGLQA